VPGNGVAVLPDANGYPTASGAATFTNWPTSNGFSGSFNGDHGQSMVRKADDMGI